MWLRLDKGVLLVLEKGGFVLWEGNGYATGGLDGGVCCLGNGFCDKWVGWLMGGVEELDGCCVLYDLCDFMER